MIFLGIPSGKLTYLWKITIFNGKIHYKWAFSIAMLNYKRVSMDAYLTVATHSGRLRFKGRPGSRGCDRAGSLVERG
jgi:hypothetical protein